MKIQQKNLDNVTGFFQKDDTNFGVDENGQLADGFQYEDALHWEGSPANHIQAQSIPDFFNWIKGFDNMFFDIAQNLVNTIKPKKVLDLGSGSGILVKYIRDLDPSIITVTVDANRDTVKSPYIDENHFIARTDMPLDFRDTKNKKVIFDLILCLDHLEHISENRLNDFMQNVVDHSDLNTKFIFAANADPYPHESHKHIHCNAKPGSYWIDIIQKFGFEPYENEFFLGRSHNSSEIFCKRIK
jgi:SAM-dependent methyltransferase